MFTYHGDVFDESMEGISYRIEVAKSGGVYNNDVFTKQPNAMIEKVAGRKEISVHNWTIWLL